MTNEVKNIPKLRFPEFIEEWCNKDVGQVVNVYDGTHQTPKYTNKGIKFLSVENIKTLKSNKFISKEAFEKDFKVRPEFGDILMTRIGDVGTPKVVNSNEDLAYYVSLALLKPKSIYSYFLEALIKSPTIQNEIWRKTLHIAFPKKINKNEIAKIMISYPKSEEQEKIGNFFSKLDRQIELEEQKLEKLEGQKKGYMQKIFSQELRFKDENGNTFEEWKNTNFNYFMSEPDNLEKGIDLRKDQLLTVKLEGNGVSKANINRALKMGSTVYYKRFAGQFIYGKQNFFNGAFGIVPKFLNNYYSSGDVPALNIDYSKIDSKYFINYISRKDYYKKKEAFSTGTGSKRIHEKTLLDFDIMLPSVEEQEKIGDFFSEIDNFIEKQSYKVELLKERKKGFLQKMFV
ncbi:restriction endonuclease subunit S [Staphylococcus saprophyticus]|uniref:restriction endonuclease subunit S n=1 Tax=Staphylococcus saprophyticus TaxID=29385 RepID=UPI00398B496F